LGEVDTKRVLAFTRFARALPKPTFKATSHALLAHALNISEPTPCPLWSQRGIEDYVVGKFGNKLRKCKWSHAPGSKNAVKECSGSKGGYDGWLREVLRAFYMSDPPRGFVEQILHAASLVGQFPGKASLVNRLLQVVRGQSAPPTLIRGYTRSFCTLLAAGLFEHMNWSERPVHVSTPVSEQGAKVRVITVPPGPVFTAGSIVRTAVFPVLRKLDTRISDFTTRIRDDRTVSGFPDALRTPAERWLSADLTKATDGFSHEAIRSVLAGLTRAGLPAEWVSLHPVLWVWVIPFTT